MAGMVRAAELRVAELLEMEGLTLSGGELERLPASVAHESRVARLEATQSGGTVFGVSLEEIVRRVVEERTSMAANTEARDEAASGLAADVPIMPDTGLPECPE